MPKLRRSSRLAAKLPKKVSEANQQQPPRRSPRLAAKRRGKPNAAFVRHRPTVLDDFPMYVIECHIFPYLDYDSRINLNQCLPIWERVPTKMPAQSVMKHDMDLRIKIIQRILLRIAEDYWDPISESYKSVLNGDARLVEMTKLFKFFQLPHYFKIISLYPSFHSAVAEKITEFEAVYFEEKKGYSEECANNFILEIIKLKNKIEKEKKFFTNAAPKLQGIRPLSLHFPSDNLWHGYAK